ncbi:MAG: 4Fe-4S cluster-binding domain-containing protein [Ignavibacteria bacterium]|nr:4Fe-4S cluster-binding domain-containing protein [Ignavibacteria bacterium]
MNKLNHLEYYRLSWNLSDNSISWLEPVYKCNLQCEGCYRRNENDSHKPLDLIKEEIEVFCGKRKTDGILIAGGEPLMHPQITEISRIVCRIKKM